ncbi:hypothetical protein HY732_03375 [Candidatus Uhrbacteria bacterium]|nr:hypothetical protein [Candidatus Uhrbacteria bacterium]
MKHVCIIGVGELGGALAHILAGRKKVHVDCWDINPSRVPRQKTVQEIIPRAGVVFLAVPSSSLRAALASVVPSIAKNTIVVSCAKGIEQGSKKTADKILGELLRRGQPFAIIGGPMLAEELSGGGDGYAVVASKSKQAYARVREFFTGTSLHLEYSSDMRGVALRGVLKNIYAIGFGICDGIGLGDNTRGALMTQALREMTTILPLLGGKKGTALGLAGIGDLVATGSSRYSSNYTVGMKIGKGEKVKRHCEGRSSIVPFAALVQKRTKDLPLLFMIKSILDAGNGVRNSFCKKYS